MACSGFSKLGIWALFSLISCTASSGYVFLEMSPGPSASISSGSSPYYTPTVSPVRPMPSGAPDSLVPLLPSSPLYPFTPNGPVSQPISGLCGLDIVALSDIIQKTAVDCMAPLAKYVADVICCPQFKSLMLVVQGELSASSGHLVLNKTFAEGCLSEVSQYLINLGAYESIPILCSFALRNLSEGLCPITQVAELEKVISKNDLLAACTATDPLKECCKPVCGQAINDAAKQLASKLLSSLQGQRSLEAQAQRQVVDDCEEVVLAWLASQLGPEAANAAFRNLYNCEINKVCPLQFKDPSGVVNACNGLSPSNETCCSSLYSYISELQSQMLITNVQALDCVTLLGTMLKNLGVDMDVYSVCQIDLKDFSLQVHGEQGCLLRAIPSDVINDKSSGISFTCDLNDNIAAPWPSNTSQSSFPLCASPASLPALPAPPMSGEYAGSKHRFHWSTALLQFCTLLML